MNAGPGCRMAQGLGGVAGATSAAGSAGQFGSIVTWAKGIDPKTGRPIFDYAAADYWTKGETKTVFPGSQGAHNWQPMSYNPGTGLVYIPTNNTPQVDAHDPDWKPGTTGFQLGIDTSVGGDTPPTKAVRTANWTWLGVSTGAPQNAITQ